MASMFTFFKSMTLKRRLLKTLERLKFKAQNPDSKLYGYFGAVDFFETKDYSVYGIGDFQIKEYKTEKKVELLKKQKKQMIVEGLKVLCVMNTDYLNKTFDAIDDITNNDTK